MLTLALVATGFADDTAGGSGLGGAVTGVTTGLWNTLTNLGNSLWAVPAVVYGLLLGPYGILTLIVLGLNSVVIFLFGPNGIFNIFLTGVGNALGLLLGNTLTGVGTLLYQIIGMGVESSAPPS